MRIYGKNDALWIAYFNSQIAFAINEHFDKILLDWMQVDMADIGAYSACYKIRMFMVLFRYGLHSWELNLFL